MRKVIKKNRNLNIEACEPRTLLAADVGSALEPPLVSDDIETAAAEVAPIDGVGNNVANPEFGSTDTQLLRITSVEYEDRISDPAGSDLPSAREVSNALASQSESVLNDRHLSDIAWVWGQFLDHDIDLTENADPAEALPIEVPSGDEYFDPFNTGTQTIDFNRSTYDPDTGDSTDNARQQINQITAFLDGSVVYGSDAERADALRTFEGGKLKTSEGDLLPFNEEGLENAGGTSSSLFLAGDIRANENAALTAMQTLWVREHNRLADEISASDPSLTDEEIYQQARSIVAAEIRAITYNEFLPALLGTSAISEYAGYDPTVDPGISNIFSTAAYRFGHSMLSTELLRLNDDGTVIDAGNISLSDAFFAPDEIINNGIDSILLGAASQQAQEIDTMVVDDVRNFLFGPPGAGGFDLASLNIQRGRDHGLPDYNQARIDLGLDAVSSFDEITSDPELTAALEATYGDVNNIDVWVGALAEDHLPGASVGELHHAIFVDQFARIRDGDRFWYQNVFSGEALRELENTTLSDVIQRNTDITNIQDNAFFDPSVLLVQAPAQSQPQPGRAGMNVSIVMDEDSVDVVDLRSGQVVESRPADSVAQVLVLGEDGQPDNITIDVSQAEFTVPDGMYIDGGDGGGDRLTVRGTPEFDSIQVDSNVITINGEAMDISGIEEVRILTGPGPDDVEVADDVDMNVIVDVPDTRPDERHHRPGPAGPPRRTMNPPPQVVAAPAPAPEPLDPRDDRPGDSQAASSEPPRNEEPVDGPFGSLDESIADMVFAGLGGP